RQGNVESFTFSSGQITSITDNAGLQTSFSYDTDEITVTDGHGNETLLSFDAGRLMSIVYGDPDGGGALLAPHEDFTYTTNGSIATRTVWPDESDSTGSEVTEFTYTADGRLESIQLPSGELQEFTPAYAVSSGAGSIGSPFALTLAEDVYGIEEVDGIITRTKYNAGGQAIETIQNYVYGPTF